MYVQSKRAKFKFVLYSRTASLCFTSLCFTVVLQVCALQSYCKFVLYSRTAVCALQVCALQSYCSLCFTVVLQREKFFDAKTHSHTHIVNTLELYQQG